MAMVWAAIAVAAVLTVIYMGIDGVVFMFVVLVVAVPVWARVVRERGGKSNTNLERQLSELSSKISELSMKIDELRRAMEE